MRTSLLLAAATLCLTAGASQAMPLSADALNGAAAMPIENAAVYVYEGNRFCFYNDGWNGPGWYRCGFSSRRGVGWGGVYGWQGWNYGPAARRFGHGGSNTHEGRNWNGGARSGATVEGRGATVPRAGGGGRSNRETTGRGGEFRGGTSGAQVPGGGAGRGGGAGAPAAGGGSRGGGGGGGAPAASGAGVPAAGGGNDRH